MLSPRWRRPDSSWSGRRCYGGGDRHPCLSRVNQSKEDEMDRQVDRRTVAKGAGALASAAATRGLLPATAAATAQTPTESSLYDRLGGIFAISAVVDRFSDKIITNPKLNENP